MNSKRKIYYNQAKDSISQLTHMICHITAINQQNQIGMIIKYVMNGHIRMLPSHYPRQKKGR